MKILFISSEVAPYSKTGGLADVSEALPKALARAGHEVCVVTPFYLGVSIRQPASKVEKLTLRFPFGNVTTAFRLHDVEPRLQVVFIDIPEFFHREGLYGDGAGEYSDNALRMGVFSLAALSSAQWLSFQPDIVHLNDWQTGLAALALKSGFAKDTLGRARSVVTVHNLAYQGVFEPSCLAELGIPKKFFHQEGVEFYGQVSFLKAALAYSDAITTVSPTYAKEILTPEGGHGMDGFLRTRASSVSGILNGIDLAQWSPMTDSHLPAHFAEEDLSGKAVCKAQLLTHMGLSREKFMQRPVFAVVSRLAEQKGLRLVLDNVQKLVDANAALVVLGKGDTAIEQAFLEAARRFPDHVAVQIGFDVPLSHQIEAGADFFLMPSLFEPCGLNQMYSLNDGTIPIVRAVGGLEDSVVDLSLPDATGIKFSEFHADALASAIDRALTLYQSPSLLAEIQKRGMQKDFSWKNSAAHYVQLYESLCALDSTS